MPKTSELRAKQRAIETEARERIDSITDDTDNATAKRIEAEVDALLAQRDRVAAEIEERQDAVLDGAENGDPRRPSGGEAAVRGNGQPADNSEAEPAYAIRSDERFADHVAQRSNGEFRELGTGDYLRAMVLGAKSDLEKRALAEGTDSAGGYTVPDILSARMIDRLRAASVVFRAGAQTVPLGSDTNYVARVETDPEPAWRSENATVDESDPTFGRVVLEPKSLAVIVRVSRELLDDSVNISSTLPRILAEGMAQELDRVAMFGSGAAPEPQGVTNFSGLTANSYAGGALESYGPLIQARTALRSANSDVSAYVLNPRDEGTLAGLTANDGQPLSVPSAISQVPMLTTTKVPTDGGAGEDESQIIAGDWRRLMVGMRQDLRIEVLRERYADQLQYAFLAFMRADIAAEHEAAFTVLDGITPAE